MVEIQLSFMQFLGFGRADTVPPANTIWMLHETLAEAGAKSITPRFRYHLASGQVSVDKWPIIDAGIVAAPLQRITETGTQDIKAARVPTELRLRSIKLYQKDRDARLSVKYAPVKRHEDCVQLVGAANSALRY